MFFYASDRGEPRHVHVEREKMVAKLWLDPVRLERSGGFSRTELNSIREMVEDHQARLREAWREYFQG